MNCISCRRSTSLPGARYCVHCGARLDAPLWSDAMPAVSLGEAAELDAGAVPCPRCGKRNAERHVYCAFCGSRMAAETPPRAAGEAERTRAAELTEAARQALARDAMEQATAQCEEALGLDPRNAETHAVMAEIYHRRGSLGGALHEMTEAVRLAPADAELERRLRELREEQDRAVEPVLRELREPRDRPRRRPAPRPRLAPAQKWPAPQWRAPEWLPAIALIGGIMLLLALLPRMMGSAMMGIGFLIGVLAAIFVYQDARARGMSLPIVLLWTAGVFLSRGIGLLVYLLITRARR